MIRKLLVIAVGAVVVAGCGHISVISNLSTGEGGDQIQGSGKVTTVTKQVGTFKGVQLDGSMDADITIGKQTGLKISGDDNIVPLVKTELKGDTLRIYVEGSYSTHHGLKVTFSVPELTKAALNGSGDLVLHSYRGKDLNLMINGSGDLKADGSVDTLVTGIEGSGSLNLYGLSAKDANVSISGSGDAEVNATSKLTATIAGSGEIRYKGKPKSVNRSIAGSGDIQPAN